MSLPSNEELAATSDSGPVLNIVGQRVALGPVYRELTATYNRWINDFAMNAQLGQLPAPITVEQSIRGYDSRLDRDAEVRFVIYERRGEDGYRPIGIALLGDIDYRHRTGEYVIFIGEPDARSKGYGTETTRLMLNYAFSTLGLLNVLLTVFAFNERARRAYERAGFKEFGRRRQCYFMNGQFWDTIFMDCVAADVLSSSSPEEISPR